MFAAHVSRRFDRRGIASGDAKPSRTSAGTYENVFVNGFGPKKRAISWAVSARTRLQ